MKSRRLALLLVVAMVVASVAATNRACAADRPEVLPLLAENVGVVRQVAAIQSINLLNGLNLSQDQMKKLLEVVEAIAAELAKASTLAAAHRDEAIRVLASLEAAVWRGERPGKQEAERVQELMLMARDESLRYIDRSSRLAGEVFAMLSPSQRLVVQRYHPCLVPAQVTEDESFVGGADTSEMMEGIEKIRGLNGLVYFFVKQKIIGTLAEKLTTVHPEFGRQDVEHELSVLFDGARACSDVEWELQKNDIARGFMTRFGPLRHFKGNGTPLEDKVRQFLLNPSLVPLLRERLAGRV